MYFLAASLNNLVTWLQVRFLYAHNFRLKPEPLDVSDFKETILHTRHMETTTLIASPPHYFRSAFFQEGSSYIKSTQTLWLPLWLGWMGTLMFFTLLTALQGHDGLPYLLGGLGLGALALYGWLTGYVHRQPAEIIIEEDVAHIRTIWEVSQGLSGAPFWVTGFMAKSPDRCTVNFGPEVFELTRTNWPSFESLTIALAQASELGSAPLRVSAPD